MTPEQAVELLDRIDAGVTTEGDAMVVAACLFDWLCMIHKYDTGSGIDDSMAVAIAIHRWCHPCAE